MKKMLVGAMVVASVAMTGCGGDKFVGQWLGEEIGWHKEAVVYDIQKNGDGYLIDAAAYRYNEKKVVTEQGNWSQAIMRRDGNYIPDTYEYRYTWTKHQRKPMSAIEKDGRLLVDDPRMPGLFSGQLNSVMAYLEDTKELLYMRKKYVKSSTEKLEEHKKKERTMLEDKIKQENLRRKTKHTVKFID